MPRPRKPDETLEQYHTTLREEQRDLKARLKGRVFWDSGRQGTYRRGMKKE